MTDVITHDDRAPGVGKESLKIGVSPCTIADLQIRNAITLADSRVARCHFGQVVQRSLNIEGRVASGMPSCGLR